MFTVHATYDNGKIIFTDNPPIKKGKILITFLDKNVLQETGKKLPTKNLGDVIDMERENLYGEYLSHRY